MTLDDVRHLGLMRTLGEAVVRYLDARAAAGGPPPFAADWVDAAGHDLLVTRAGAKERGRNHLPASRSAVLAAGPQGRVANVSRRSQRRPAGLPL